MNDYAVLRERMVRDLIAARGVADAKVLAALRQVPRHLFVRDHLRSQAYGDHALPIGAAQTISQPYIVARMTELLELAPHHSVLEIGTGSGYQTAILARLARRVYSLERIAELAQQAIPRSTAPSAGASGLLTIGSWWRREPPRCPNPCWSSSPPAAAC
jgi:protein-L-isoaspartate(D-aspartate) O-methyltransferase